MIQKVVSLPEVGDVILKKNTRSKHIRLYVKPNKQVVVSLPARASFHSAEKFALKNLSWIIKQQAKYNPDDTRFTKNAVYFTKYHTIKIQEDSVEKPQVTTDDKTVTVSFPQNTDTGLMQKVMQSVVTEVYRCEAKQYLPERLSWLANRYGFRYNKVTVRNNRTNWGSCSSANNISLNLNLMKLPDALIDYILLHELTHTVVKNHGSGFYQVLNKLTGGKARELAREIKKYAAYTY
jgi:predicted metal-dependent hydrolase